VRVRTDVLDVLIDSQGGDLVRADLLQYPIDKRSPDQLVRLLNNGADNLWVFQTGLRSAVGGTEPNHLATFRSASSDYALAAGQDELVVTFDWVGDGTLSARKTYTFRRGQYGVNLALSAQPAAGGSWRGAPYVQMTRVHHPVARSYFSVDSYSFTGPVLYNGDQYKKLDVEDLAQTPITQTLPGGWFAAIQHHFLAAAVPPMGDDFRYDASMRGQEFLLSAIGPIADVTAAAPLSYSFTLFVGPKVQDQLKAIGEELDLTVDYGVLTVLAQPLFWLLSKIEIWVNNWGWAIIICTMLIKLAFYKLTATSGRSMAKMRRLAPRMKALQERYKDDRQALSQAMMELYKREKVNPAAGCLPMLIQMPFFFSFYCARRKRRDAQAPFMLWINDLSARDPYFVLPLLMGVAMFFQTRMSPAPPDPMQARVMQIMPVVFTGMFLFFPAGLVLYWLTNTALSILQQWRINKVVERESAPT
jgi:YidC/Oxa1 family membrane protein insertase